MRAADAPMLQRLRVAIQVSYFAIARIDLVGHENAAGNGQVTTGVPHQWFDHVIS
jgi:hypothetical protein